MSEVFHKSFYTTRSAGYKYRTLSTNTATRFGDLLKFKEDGKYGSIWERKIAELRKAILTKVSKEALIAGEIRESMNRKFEVIDAKVDSMLKLQDTVLLLRKDLNAAGSNLMSLIDKVDRIEAISYANSFLSQRTYKPPESVCEDPDELSIVTYLPAKN